MLGVSMGVPRSASLRGTHIRWLVAGIVLPGSLAERWVLVLRGGRCSISLDTALRAIGGPLGTLSSVSVGGRLAAIPVRGCLAGLGSVTVGGSLRGLRAIHRSLTRRRAVAVGARCSWHRRATVVGGISRPERVEAGVARLLRGDGALRVACHSVLRAVDAGVVRHIADVLARLPIKDDVDDGRGQKMIVIIAIRTRASNVVIIEPDEVAVLLRVRVRELLAKAS